MAKRGRPRHPDVLTPREWEVLALIREGLSNQDIGSRLGISIDGVKYHVSEILGKLGLENRHDAARWQPDSGGPRRARALLPFGLAGRLRGAGPWLGGALAVVVVAGLGVLVWALLAQRDGGGAARAALPPGDRLAYVGIDGNIWHVEDGSATQLTEGRDAGAPQWSPDGGQLLYVQDGLYLLDESGASRLISESVVRAEWSPDGSHIAYQREVGGLWLYNVADQTRQEPVTDAFSLSDFAWAPDGQQLALARSAPVIYPDDLTTLDTGVEIPEDNGLYLLDTAGGEPKPVMLRQDLLDSLPAGWDFDFESKGLGLISVTSLDWSPDGEWISFHPRTLSASAPNDGLPIFTVRRDGSSVADHGVKLIDRELLHWFPDGHRFAFTLGAGRETHRNKLIAVAEAGVDSADVIAEEPERAAAALGNGDTVSARSDGWPDVSPDGSRIVFQASETNVASLSSDIGKLEGPREGIWIVDADGTNARQLTSGPQHLDFFPRWTADSASVLFIRTDGQPIVDGAGTPPPGSHAELWLVSADGGEPRLLIDDMQRPGGYYGLFTWERNVDWYRAQ